MHLYLGRQADGSYMLTALHPVRAVVVGTTHEDLYLAPGEPIGVRHLCAAGTRALFGADLDPLDVQKVTLCAEGRICAHRRETP